MNNKTYNFVCIVSVIYLIGICAFMIHHRVFLLPDQFFALAMIFALALGRLIQFLRDWLLPTILLLAYEYLRGLAPYLVQTVNIYPMIDFDQFFFGAIPSITLQNLLHTRGQLYWYDYMASILYISHFVVPLLIGFLFWIKDRHLFKKYYLTLLILSYMGFVTYVLFPAMPPWMAGDKGIIEPVDHSIIGQVFQTLPNGMHLPTVYQFFDGNKIAAVPSLHAAYPVVTFFFLVSLFGSTGGIIAAIYVLSVWFSIIYLGDHYVFDILIGLIYAVVAHLLVVKWPSIQSFMKPIILKHKLAKAKA